MPMAPVLLRLRFWRAVGRVSPWCSNSAASLAAEKRLEMTRLVRGDAASSRGGRRRSWLAAGAPAGERDAVCAAGADCVDHAPTDRGGEAAAPCGFAATVLALADDAASSAPDSSARLSASLLLLLVLAAAATGVTAAAAVADAAVAGADCASCASSCVIWDVHCWQVVVRRVTSVRRC